MTGTTSIGIRVNGEDFEREVEDRLTLADFLRSELRLTGTHLGCEQGSCGACTVLLDGSAIRSCLVFASQLTGAEVTTVEGLANQADLHPLQSAFIKNDALQCGFCTPGFLLTAVEILNETDHADESTIREAISGNICRCTGYQGIVDAIVEVARSGSER
ncbi:MAG: (2Fe-2S)-binding protein [Acidimicrobiaceae bacterium]|nr:(2Fe-2S)-binding protein [Acidimicrobiaceae bacterium]